MGPTGFPAFSHPDRPDQGVTEFDALEGVPGPFALTAVTLKPSPVKTAARDPTTRPDAPAEGPTSNTEAATVAHSTATRQDDDNRILIPQQSQNNE